MFTLSSMFTAEVDLNLNIIPEMNSRDNLRRFSNKVFVEAFFYSGDFNSTKFVLVLTELTLNT